MGMMDSKVGDLVGWNSKGVDEGLLRGGVCWLVLSPASQPDRPVSQIESVQTEHRFRRGQRGSADSTKKLVSQSVSVLQTHKNGIHSHFPLVTTRQPELPSFRYLVYLSNHR